MNSLEQMTQTACLRNGFINYLLDKRAAGIVNITVPNVSASNYLNKKLNCLEIVSGSATPI